MSYSSHKYIGSSSRSTSIGSLETVQYHSNRFLYVNVLAGHKVTDTLFGFDDPSFLQFIVCLHYGFSCIPEFRKQFIHRRDKISYLFALLASMIFLISSSLLPRCSSKKSISSLNSCFGYFWINSS